MKKMIFSLAFLFINIVQSSSQNTDTVFTDTIFVSVDELLKNKKNMVELEVKEGQVISFKANKELLTHSRIFFKFWKNQEGIYGLHSKGKIVFGRKNRKSRERPVIKYSAVSFSGSINFGLIK